MRVPVETRVGSITSQYRYACHSALAVRKLVIARAHHRIVVGACRTHSRAFDIETTEKAKTADIIITQNSRAIARTRGGLLQPKKIYLLRSGIFHFYRRVEADGPRVRRARERE